MSGSSTPYPIGDAKNLQEALVKIQQYFDEMYQERVGGALIGDVMAVGDDEILALRLSSLGGLQKLSGELALLPDPAGAIDSTASGVYVVLRGNGGLAKDTAGLFINVTAKGDLVIGTGNKTVAVLPITGITDGWLLSKGGAGATGLQWIAPLPTGLTTNVTVVTDIGPPQVTSILHFTDGVLTSIT